MSVHHTYKDEYTLIKHLKKGNNSAYEYIFDLYYDHLCNYARKLISDNDLSEDIVHNTFCNIWIKRKKIDINSSLKSYLFNSVYNSAISHIRSKKVEAKYVEDKYFQFIENDMILTPDKEIEIVNTELIQFMYSAIEQLPRKCREIFKMSRFSGMKNKEIAQELDISINTVQTQMGIALSKLRESLGDNRFILLMYFLDKNKKKIEV
ncbi:MAG: RNA polymerase sigma-70 factor [Marinifilaceae bacterium]|jgi:RNA polymerase sigma-70 factor (ECF subfamily)|nr:RNA polymerase sigma-70 factor [Marinifilaceae bacterium]